MERQPTYERVYVKVNADFPADGEIVPRVLYWAEADGMEKPYAIDRILSVKPAHSRKAGGQGLLFAVRIQGREKSLFYDDFTRHFFIEQPIS